MIRYALPLLLAVVPAAAADVVADVEAWRGERVERLTRPEGWLSLVGLHWVEPGSQRIGRDAGNDLVLAVGPAHLGVLTLDGARVHLALADGVDASIEGTEARAADLVVDSAGAPTVVRFGRASFVAIERNGRVALRVRDPDAPTRTGFSGIEYFPIDPAWRVDARFEAHPAGKTIEIVNILGALEPMANPGRVVFSRDGREYALEAVDEGDGQLFLIFADRTNGPKTYGPGRFVYAPAPVDGRTVIDFNRAYNPPCAFNAYSTCPLPPPENRLDLAVEAGELKYAGPR